MAGINSLVTHGIGPGSSILFVLTGGLGVGEAVAPAQVAVGDYGPAARPRKHRLIEPDGRVRTFRNRRDLERRIAELVRDDAPEAVEKVERPVKRNPKKRRARVVGTEFQTEAVAALTIEAQRALDALIRADADLQMSMILAALRGAQNDEEDALMAILAVAA